METLHQPNIGLHVASGSLALLLGVVPLLVRKGGAAHVRLGRWFLRVLVAAFTGTVLPQFKPHSQFLPSLVGLALQVGFVLYYARWARRPAFLRHLRLTLFL